METRHARVRKAGLNRLDLNLGYIQIQSLDILQAYVEFMNRNEDQNVCIVEIELRDKWDQPVRRIFNLLFRTPSVDTLWIDLKLPKSKALCLFQKITLPKLEHLSCRNIHHTALAEFVERHQTLRSLSIGCCTGGGCALSTLSREQDIQEISGPSPCINGLVSRTTEVLHVIWDPSNTSEDKDALLFNRVKAVQANISLLSIQFFPGDITFARRVSEAFPRLSTLKLVEAPLEGGHVNTTRYPWDVSRGLWKEGLDSLVYLKRLHVQTALPPIAQPGERESELKLINALTGNKQKNLVDVTLEYFDCEFSYESAWQRLRGTWDWRRLSQFKTSKTP